MDYDLFHKDNSVNVKRNNYDAFKRNNILNVFLLIILYTFKEEMEKMKMFQQSKLFCFYFQKHSAE